MKVKLYQINLDRDIEGLAFMSQQALSRMVENPKVIDSSIYDCVFDGEIDGNTLGDIFATFNFRYPDGFHGRSMSVSDIVVTELVKGKQGAYFCDSIGFTNVEFDMDAAKELRKEITVVMLEPGKMARTETIDSSLEGMQKIVGGLIEAYYPFEEAVCIVYNEEGKINGMPLNRAIYAEPEDGAAPGTQLSEDRQMIDIIAGPCFICDCSGEDFGSLTDEQINRYMEQFKCPERFYKIGDEIRAVPYSPQRNQER